MMTQDSKSFDKDMRYSIDLGGGSIQPCLVTLTDCIKILEAERTKLNAQYIALGDRIRHLELLRDKLWDSKPLETQEEEHY